MQKAKRRKRNRRRGETSALRGEPGRGRREKRQTEGHTGRGPGADGSIPKAPADLGWEEPMRLRCSESVRKVGPECPALQSLTAACWLSRAAQPHSAVASEV